MMPDANPSVSWQQRYVRVFRALSEPLRLEMITLFDEDDSCACASLEDALPISKSTISYHVKILRQAGLITAEKEGRFHRYTLRRDTFDELLPGFLDRLTRDSGIGADRDLEAGSVPSPRNAPQHEPDA